jgi:hypothetical protein
MAPARTRNPAVAPARPVQGCAGRIGATLSDTPPTGSEAGQDRMARLVRTCVIVLLLAVIIFSREIAVPALAAVLLSIALFPIVNRMSRLGMPRARPSRRWWRWWRSAAR